jgi:2-polyprenyl-6-methoxyphenol hydroxylase-like FAD-dependent oxidoreductase
MLGQGGCQAVEDAVVLAHHHDDLAAYSAARLPRTTAIARQSVRAARLNLMSGRARTAVRDTAIVVLSKAVPGLLLRSFDSVAGWRPPQQPYASGSTPAGKR